MTHTSSASCAPQPLRKLRPHTCVSLWKITWPLKSLSRLQLAYRIIELSKLLKAKECKLQEQKTR